MKLSRSEHRSFRGVLVALSTVLTASHCRVAPDAIVYFYSGSTPNGTGRYVSRVVTPPGVNPLVCTTSNRNSCGYTDSSNRFADMALLALAFGAFVLAPGSCPLASQGVVLAA